MSMKVRLGLVAVAVVLVAVFRHPLGTFLYNHSPDLFRSAVAFEHTENGTYWFEVKNHITITIYAVGLAALLCTPLGIIASRRKGIRAVSTNFFGIARGIPAIAVLFLLWSLGSGQGTRPVLIALFLLACPSIFLNSVAGYAGVDRAVIEAARGMGMNGRQVLLKIETPLAIPLVLAGLRIATIDVIATATVASYVNYSSLGDEIVNAVPQLPAAGQGQLALGVASVAMLALSAELILSVIQRVVTPPAVSLP